MTEEHKKYQFWYFLKVYEALILLLDNTYLRFDTKLRRHIKSILIGTNCAPLPADVLLFCYEGDSVMSLSHDK